MIEINFFAVASPKFLVNLQNSCVCMKFSAAELGGWKTLHKTDYVR